MGDIEIVRRHQPRSESANELMLLARYYEQEVRETEVDFDTLLKAIDLIARQLKL
jgi:streptomycin 6-kinase